MSKHSWSPAHLSTIGAQLTKLPETALHWSEMKSVRDKIADLMAVANVEFAKIEDSAELTGEGKKAKAAEVAKETIAKIEAATDSATKAAARRTQALETKLSGVIEKPADAAVAQEIRAHIKSQPSPVMAALALVGDPQTVSALCGAPPYLSGLSGKDIALLKSKALGTTKESIEIGEINGALQVVSSAVKSAASMISQRAGAREAPKLLQPAEIAKA